MYRLKNSNLAFLMLVLLSIALFGPASTLTYSDYISPDLDQNSIESIIVNSNDPAISITNNTQLNSSSSSGDGSMANPWVITGKHISSPGTNAIYITNTTDWVTIENSVFTNGTNGIMLHNVTNVIINNVTVYNNAENGIYVSNSTNVQIFESEVYNNGISCSSVSLDNHSGTGIHFNPSTDLVVENNSIHDNYRSGMIIYSATNLDITGNEIYDNGGWCNNQMIELNSNYHSSHGIEMDEGINVKMIYNSFIHNTIYGVSISSNSNNVNATLNNFIINGYNEDIQQAEDNATSTFHMNYWSDFDPEVNEVYPLDGSSGTTDAHPCSEPVQFGDTTCEIAEVGEDIPDTTTTTTTETITVEAQMNWLPALVAIFFVTITIRRRKNKNREIT